MAEERVDDLLEALGGEIMSSFGTSAVAAVKNKRNFIGFDINPACVDIANGRVREVWNENLQTF